MSPCHVSTEKSRWLYIRLLSIKCQMCGWMWVRKRREEDKVGDNQNRKIEY